jgi:hypothetical protein
MNSLQNRQAPDQYEWLGQVTEHPVVSAQQARQGVTGHNVRYVLGVGTAAIILAFIVVYLVYFG